MKNLYFRGLQIFLLLTLLLFNFGPGASTVHAAPPLNDNFANATPIPSISYTDTVNTREATQQPGVDPDNVGPCTGTGNPPKRMNIGNYTVWYRYQPSVNESIAVDTIGSLKAPGDDLDTYIAVWTGSPGSLSLVTCNDDNFVGQTSQLSFLGTASVTYYIQIASFNCYEGDSSCGPEPGGDLAINVNITNTDVFIGGSPIGSYYVPSGGRVLPYFPGVQTGPVQVVSTTGAPIFTSQRSLYGPYSTFNEVMGYPNNQLWTKYWFTWYDDLAQQTWILVGNPSTSQTAHVTIKIAGVTMGPGIYDVPPNGRILPHYPGVQNGPVEISSDISVFASQRSIYGAASNFLEILGFPNNQLTTKYWFTWYDHLAQQTWVLIGAP